MDSLSRTLVYERLLELTALFREWNVNPVNAPARAFDFRQYSIIAGGTHNNVPAFTCGRLQKYCPVTGEKWIFTRAKEQGYVTSFAAEECPYDKNALASLQLRYSGGTPSKLNPDKLKDMLKRGASIADHTLYNIMCGIANSKEVGNVWSNNGVPKICFGGRSVLMPLSTQATIYICVSEHTRVRLLGEGLSCMDVSDLSCSVCCGG